MDIADVTFPAIEAVSLRDKVLVALKDAFVSGALKPGDMIVERRLAEKMRIGTPAVREALITLEQQGFVRRVANTATYVREFTVDEARQIYLLRIEIECLGLLWAKQHVTEDDIRVLEGIVEAMACAAREKKVREFYEQDLAFHRYCGNLSRNKFLPATLETLVTPLFAFTLNANVQSGDESVAREHSNIVNALRDLQDPEFSFVIRSTLNNFALRGIAALQGARQPAKLGASSSAEVRAV